MTKPIIVKESNARRLADFLQAAQGNATARTLDANDVIEFATRLDDDAPFPLAIMSRDEWRGAVIVWRPCHKLPNSYKWRADATAVRMERRASGWSIVSAWRETANESESNKISVRLPHDVAEKARRRFESTFLEASQCDL